MKEKTVALVMVHPPPPPRHLPSVLPLLPVAAKWVQLTGIWAKATGGAGWGGGERGGGGGGGRGTGEERSEALRVERDFSRYIQRQRS